MEIDRARTLINNYAYAASTSATEKPFLIALLDACPEPIAFAREVLRYAHRLEELAVYFWEALIVPFRTFGNSTPVRPEVSTKGNTNETLYRGEQRKRRRLLSKRDGKRCLVTGLRETEHPLVVAPIIPYPHNDKEEFLRALHRFAPSYDFGSLFTGGNAEHPYNALSLSYGIAHEAFLQWVFVIDPEVDDNGDDTLVIRRLQDQSFLLLMRYSDIGTSAQVHGRSLLPSLGNPPNQAICRDLLRVHAALGRAVHASGRGPELEARINGEDEKNETEVACEKVPTPVAVADEIQHEREGGDDFFEMDLESFDDEHVDGDRRNSSGIGKVVVEPPESVRHEKTERVENRLLLSRPRTRPVDPGKTTSLRVNGSSPHTTRPREFQRAASRPSRMIDSDKTSTVKEIPFPGSSQPESVILVSNSDSDASPKRNIWSAGKSASGKKRRGKLLEALDPSSNGSPRPMTLMSEQAREGKGYEEMMDTVIDGYRQSRPSSSCRSTSKNEQPCPLCSRYFPADEIEAHASDCLGPENHTKRSDEKKIEKSFTQRAVDFTDSDFTTDADGKTEPRSIKRPCRETPKLGSSAKGKAATMSASKGTTPYTRLYSRNRKDDIRDFSDSSENECGLDATRRKQSGDLFGKGIRLARTGNVNGDVPGEYEIETTKKSFSKGREKSSPTPVPEEDVCPICDQMFPMDKLQEHVELELVKLAEDGIPTTTTTTTGQKAVASSKVPKKIERVGGQRNGVQIQTKLKLPSLSSPISTFPPSSATTRNPDPPEDIISTFNCSGLASARPAPSARNNVVVIDSDDDDAVPDVRLGRRDERVVGVSEERNLAEEFEFSDEEPEEEYGESADEDAVFDASPLDGFLNLHDPGRDRDAGLDMFMKQFAPKTFGPVSTTPAASSRKKKSGTNSSVPEDNVLAQGSAATSLIGPVTSTRKSVKKPAAPRKGRFSGKAKFSGKGKTRGTGRRPTAKSQRKSNVPSGPSYAENLNHNYYSGDPDFGSMGGGGGLGWTGMGVASLGGDADMY